MMCCYLNVHFQGQRVNVGNEEKLCSVSACVISDSAFESRKTSAPPPIANRGANYLTVSLMMQDIWPFEERARIVTSVRTVNPNGKIKQSLSTLWKA